MTINDSIQWLTNLHEAMGDAQYQGLWHFEQALVETIELLKRNLKYGPSLNPNDKVYRVCMNLDARYGVEELEVISLELFGDDIVRYYARNTENRGRNFFEGDIGDRIFLTKEKAEERRNELNV